MAVKLSLIFFQTFSLSHLSSSYVYSSVPLVAIFCRYHSLPHALPPKAPRPAWFTPSFKDATFDLNRCAYTQQMFEQISYHQSRLLQIDRLDRRGRTKSRSFICMSIPDTERFIIWRKDLKVSFSIKLDKIAYKRSVGSADRAKLANCLQTTNCNSLERSFSQEQKL